MAETHPRDARSPRPVARRRGTGRGMARVAKIGGGDLIGRENTS